jgi:hypothetical protein
MFLSRPVLVLCTLLLGAASVYAAGDSLVHFRPMPSAERHGKPVDLEFKELERLPDASIVEVVPHWRGAPLDDALFLMHGVCKVAHARKATFFEPVRLKTPPDGPTPVSERYRITFPKAVSSPATGSIEQCELLGFL